jgi:RimJ/RimL family protein N-acetyltransferase
MIQSLNETEEQVEAPLGADDYVRTQRRRSLYRLLATNIIRQLRDAGYRGHELLGFASEVMEAITENGWEETAAETRPESRKQTDVSATRRLSQRRPGRPVLSTVRTLLRPPAPADRLFLEPWREDPLIRESLIAPLVLDHVLEHLDESQVARDRLDLVVCDRSSRKPIGLVSLYNIDEVTGQAELGKMIGDPSFRGRGAAQEATRAIVSYGFDTLGLNRVCLRTLGGNLANIRLNERIGFRFEGVLQQAAAANGALVDVVLMAMLKSEYESKNSGAAAMPA